MALLVGIICACANFGLSGNMKFKNLYKDLANLLTNLDCSVCDLDFRGYCFQTKDIKALIVISPDMSYKEKYFTLAHEAGHLFYMKKGNAFNWSEKPRSEDQANWFALQLIKHNEIESYEYKKFYNKALRASKKRKKSWFES